MYRCGDGYNEHVIPDHTKQANIDFVRDSTASLVKVII